jgi:predicted amidohydrolase
MHGKNPKRDYNGYMYDIMGKANAMMNQVWLVQSDQIGAATLSKEFCYGHSCIIDPTGSVVATTGYREGLALAEVDVKKRHTTRQVTQIHGSRFSCS